MDEMLVGEVERIVVGLGWGDATGISRIGAGAWSTAYGFTSNELDYVLRIGAHLDDFRSDEAMAKYATPTLPIPSVHGAGEAPTLDGMFYCVSRNAFENLTANLSENQTREVPCRMSMTHLKGLVF